MSVKIDPEAQREFAVEAVRQLRAKGFLALWAGGCVRDQLLSRTPKDYDVATNAQPGEIREVFGKRRTIPVGASFGVITVLAPQKAAGQLDVVTFRHDVSYSDGRRPDAVKYTTPEEDARRRDFTINGLFYDPLEHRVIDYVGGQADLDRQLIRAIGDPAERFAEDKLRMLRAVRFAAKYDFQLEAGTREAICRTADELKVVSVERIAAELRLMLQHVERSRAITLLAEVRLLQVILPMLPADLGPTLAELHRLEDPTFPLTLAVLLHRAGGEQLMVEVGTNWKLSNKEIERMAWLARHKNSLADAARQPWPRLQPLLVQDGIQELLQMHSIIHPNSAEDIEFCRGRLELPEIELNPPALINGDDLKQSGIPPGKAYQRLLDAVRDAQLLGTVTSKAEALELAQSLHRS